MIQGSNRSGTKPTWVGPYPLRTLRQNPSGERSQHRAAMPGDEEAGLRGETGCPLGLERGEPPPYWRNRSTGISCRSSYGTYTVSPKGRSTCDRMSCLSNGSLSSPMKVPLRPGLQNPVTLRYKLDMKGGDDAGVSSGGSVSSRLQGWQQSRSRTGLTPQSERQNRNRSEASIRSTGSVSPSAQATKWPDRTSSCQPGVRLSNSLTQSELQAQDSHIVIQTQS